MPDDPSVFARLFDFLSTVFGYWWVWVTGVIFLVEQAAEFFFPKMWKKVNENYDKAARRRGLIWLCMIGFVIASFQAFDDVSERARTLQRQIYSEPTRSVSGSSRVIITWASAVPEEPSPNPDYNVVFDYQNQGNIASIGTIVFADLSIGDGATTSDNIDKMFFLLQDGVKKVHITKEQNQIQPAEKYEIKNGKIKNSDFNAIISGAKPMVYAFLIKYSDEGLTDKKAWLSETCLVLGANLKYTPCPNHNRIYLANN